MITIDEFRKVDMRIGTVLSAEEVPGSRNLLKLKVDLGELGIKQAVSGIKDQYKPEDLVGKQFAFVVNLRPIKLMGELSEIMILAAVEGKEVSLVAPVRPIKNGARVE